MKINLTKSAKLESLFIDIEDTFEEIGKDYGIKMIDQDLFVIPECEFKLYHCKNTIIIEVTENKDNTKHHLIPIYFRQKDSFTGAIIIEGFYRKGEKPILYKYASKKKFCADLFNNLKKILLGIGIHF